MIFKQSSTLNEPHALSVGLNVRVAVNELNMLNSILIASVTTSR